MTPAEEDKRAAIVAEARTWLRTPYHPNARIKGAGVDCGQILIGVFADIGCIPAFDAGYYSFDWALHQDDPRYMQFILDHGYSIPGPPEPGDVVLWRFGRSLSHGAIVTAWPKIIHAQVGVGVVEADAEKEMRLCWVGHPGAERPRERLFFSWFPPGW